MMYNNDNTLKDRLDESEVSGVSGDEIEDLWKLVKETVTNVAIEVCNVCLRGRKDFRTNVYGLIVRYERL